MRTSNFGLRQLAYFIAIADAGSIALAATHLRVSQSAVAATLTQLETTLDVQLCVRRRSHGISLTAAGRMLRDRARELLYEAEVVERSVSGKTSPLVGAVLIGSPEEMAPVILPPILEALSYEHPLIEPSVEIGLEAQFYPRLADGEIDLAITLNHRLPAELDFVPLRPMTSWVALPAGHRLAERKRLRLQDLADEPWIMLDTEPGRTHATSMFHNAGITPHIAFRSPTFELARSLVGRGLGYTLHIHRPAGDVSWEGRALEVRELETQLPTEYAVIAWSRRTRPSPWAQAVIKTACEVWADAST